MGHVVMLSHVGTVPSRQLTIAEAAKSHTHKIGAGMQIGQPLAIVGVNTAVAHTSIFVGSQIAGGI